MDTITRDERLDEIGATLRELMQGEREEQRELDLRLNVVRDSMPRVTLKPALPRYNITWDKPEA